MVEIIFFCINFEHFLDFKISLRGVNFPFRNDSTESEACIYANTPILRWRKLFLGCVRKIGLNRLHLYVFFLIWLECYTMPSGWRSWILYDPDENDSDLDNTIAFSKAHRN